MPSKIQHDENLWFLYTCLQKSDLKSIDFTAVGLITNLKPPAARMRYTRLKRQIESRTLIGTHGTPFTNLPYKKRKGPGKGGGMSEGDDSEGDECREKRKAKDKIKVENQSEDGFASDENESESASDSEDEMPLAKLRKAVRYSPRPPITTQNPSPSEQIRKVNHPSPLCVGFSVPELVVPRFVPNQQQQRRMMSGFPHTATSFNTPSISGNSSPEGVGWNAGMGWSEGQLSASEKPRLSF